MSQAVLHQEAGRFQSASGGEVIQCFEQDKQGGLIGVGQRDVLIKAPVTFCEKVQNTGQCMRLARGVFFLLRGHGKKFFAVAGVTVVLGQGAIDVAAEPAQYGQTKACIQSILSGDVLYQ